MTRSQRVAIVLGLLFLIGGAAATFAPTSPGGATCGTWAAPEWDLEETREIISGASETYDGLRQLGADDDANELGRSMAGALAAATACDDALATRRTLAIALLALGVGAPAAVLFIGSGRRETD